MSAFCICLNWTCNKRNLSLKFDHKFLSSIAFLSAALQCVSIYKKNFRLCLYALDFHRDYRISLYFLNSTAVRPSSWNLKICNIPANTTSVWLQEHFWRAWHSYEERGSRHENWSIYITTQEYLPPFIESHKSRGISYWISSVLEAFEVLYSFPIYEIILGLFSDP